MDLSPIILAMAEAEGPSSVLGQVVAPLLEHDEIVLTRVWFMDDRDCTVCQGRRDPTSGTTLHLRAHGSRLGSATSGAGLDGACHLVRVGTQSRIAEIAARGEALISSRVEPLDEWGVEATCPVISEIRGVLGFPLRFRGRVVGVLACYLRTPADEGMLDWLPMFAAHAAVAIANCRALQEIQHLQEELELERDYLREEAAQIVPIDGIVGESEALQGVLRQVDLVAATEANVLLQGESGTGKELIARAIHQRSRVPVGPWSRSTVRRSPRSSLRVSSLDTYAEPSRGPSMIGSVDSNWPTAEPCSWMKWARSRWSCRPSYCACCRRVSLSGSARAPRGT